VTDPGTSHFPDKNSRRKCIIVTGDDFGLALPVNDAIIQAHQQGILTTASLMVGETYLEDAVTQARQNPSLKVGLHITLVEGRPVSLPHRIPDLLDKEGLFSQRLVRSGFRFFFHPGIRRQLETEIRAQFDAFQKTGLPLDHVSAHNHLHLHPTVLGIILRTGKDYGMKAVRVPNEPPLRSWKAAGNARISRMVSSMFLAPWLMLMRRRLRREHIYCNDFLFGMTDCGKMTTELVLRILEQLPDGTTEFCFHPATRRSPEIDATMPLFDHEGEFEALTSSSLQKAVRNSDLRIISFSDMAKPDVS
jgi:chitin disaccharide deacetylase